jgi:hypothetical protein
MKQLFVALMMVVMSSMAFAGERVSIDTSKLTAEQKEQLGKMVLQDSPKTDGELDMLEKAARFGQIIGSGIGAAARELGIAVNEFSQTTPGRVAMLILVWKYMGDAILGVMVGIPVLVLGMWVGWKMVHRGRQRNYTREYVYVPVLWGLFNRRKLAKEVYNRNSESSESDDWMQTIGYFCMFMSVVVGLNIVF